MTKVLYIEDDIPLATETAKQLTQKGFEVTHVTDLAQADEKLNIYPDIIILDWNLPDGEGLTWLIHKRKEQMMTPVLMLSARSKVLDRVSGLNMGANDYLTKPFEMIELEARLMALLGKNMENYQGSQVLKFEDLELHANENRIKRNNEWIELTPLEAKMLELFFSQPQAVYARAELLSKFWPQKSSTSTRVVDVVVSQIRQKIGNDFIRTIRGMGYQLKDESK